MLSNSNTGIVETHKTHRSKAPGLYRPGTEDFCSLTFKNSSQMRHLQKKATKTTDMVDKTQDCIKMHSTYFLLPFEIPFDVGIHTYTYIHTNIHTERQRDRETKKERATESHRETETERATEMRESESKSE